MRDDQTHHRKATMTTPRRGAPPGGDDAGLGLVEVVVSMAILAIVLLAFVPVQVSALRTVVLSGERQQATAYANQAIEQVRARVAAAGGFTAVAAGRAPDITDAANTTGCPGTGCSFKPSFDPTRPAEPLLAGASPDGVLLTQSCSKQSGCSTAGSASGGDVVFTTRLYITPSSVPPAPSRSDLITVTAVTAWPSQNSRAGLRQVAVRTQIAKPTVP